MRKLKLLIVIRQENISCGKFIIQSSFVSKSWHISKGIIKTIMVDELYLKLCYSFNCYSILINCLCIFSVLFKTPLCNIILQCNTSVYDYAPINVKLGGGGGGSGIGGAFNCLSKFSIKCPTVGQ